MHDRPLPPVDQLGKGSPSESLHDEVDEDSRLSWKQSPARVVQRQRAGIAEPAGKEPNEFTALDVGECKRHRHEGDAKPEPRRLRNCLRVTDDEAWLALHRLLGRSPRA